VEDLSDNEREEQLRRFWSENWLWIFGGIALGLAGIAGWNYWQKTRLQSAESDEKTYLAVIESLSRNDAGTAATKADDLRSTHPKSPYTDQADLALARAYVGEGKLDDAARRLRVVYESSRDPQLRIVAQTRLARVLVEQKKFDEALKLLDVGSAGSFAPVFHDVRGDVYAAKNDVAQARQEYQAALAANTSGAPIIDAKYVQLKLDALASGGPMTQASAASAPATGSATATAPVGAAPTAAPAPTAASAPQPAAGKQP